MFPYWECTRSLLNVPCLGGGVRFRSPDSESSGAVRDLVELIRLQLVIAGYYYQDFGRESRQDGVLYVNPGPKGQILEFP